MARERARPPNQLRGLVAVETGHRTSIRMTANSCAEQRLERLVAGRASTSAWPAARGSPRAPAGSPVIVDEQDADRSAVIAAPRVRPASAPRTRADLAQRQDVVDRCGGERGARHHVALGGRRILDERAPAARSRTARSPRLPSPLAPVRTTPIGRSPYASAARLEQHVDRRPAQCTGASVESANRLARRPAGGSRPARRRRGPGRSAPCPRPRDRQRRMRAASSRRQACSSGGTRPGAGRRRSAAESPPAAPPAR